MYKSRNRSTFLKLGGWNESSGVPLRHIGQADTLTVAQGRINSVWRVITSCLLFPFAPLVFYCPHALCSFGVFLWKILVNYPPAVSKVKFPLHTLCFAPLHGRSLTGAFVPKKGTPSPLSPSRARRGRSCPLRAVSISSLILSLISGCRITIVTP
jgi:hypothetical protein